MDNEIGINRDRLQQVLDGMRETGKQTALTTEIINEYMGGFHSNRSVPVRDSWNAQFGKYLKAHSETFGISEQTANVRVVIGGRTTHASLWDLKTSG